MNKVKTIIHFDQVWAAYRIEPVLLDLTWTWQADQNWGILGGNGAGKSAMAKLITDQLRPQRGTIELNPSINADKDILHLSFELQQQLIAHDIRFDDSETRDDALDIGTTVKQVVLQKQTDDSRLAGIAEQCHISHILDRGIRFVSTGESRKALLARALYQQPKILILDNPYEGLDKQSQQDMRSLLEQLLQTDINVLLLLNQQEEIPANTSHVLLLEAGQVKQQGPKDSVLSNDNGDPLITIKTLPPPQVRGYQVNKNQPLLVLNHVDVCYGEQTILNQINWTFDWGQHCCICGPNGAGKSTLLSLINGDNHKAYGQDITLFGKRRGSGESIWDIKEKFGIVSTALQLNNQSRQKTLEVVASGLQDCFGLHADHKGTEQQIAQQWLQVMELADLADKPYYQLSFGQQRLVMLARAMVKSPLILILDEPCLGLDSYHRKLILALVDQIALKGDCHILYVSHTDQEIPDCINQYLTLMPSELGGYTSQQR